MTTFWWLVDECGCMNFFNSGEAYRYARKHYPGMREGECSPGDMFEAVDVKDCWSMKDLMKYEDGYEVLDAKTN